MKVNIFRLQTSCVNVVIKVSGNLSINFSIPILTEGPRHQVPAWTELSQN